MALRTSSRLTYAAHTNPAVPAPTSVSGDVLVMVAAVYSASAVPTPPAGWVPFPGAAGGLLATATDFGVSMKLYGWTKVAASEPASYTVTQPAASSAYWIGAHSGASAVTGYVSGSGTGTTSTVGGITTTADGALVYVFGADDGDTSNALSIAGSTPTFANLFASPVVLEGASGVMSPAGSTGSKSFANNNVGGQGWAAVIFAVQPAATRPDKTATVTVTFNGVVQRTATVTLSGSSGGGVLPPAPVTPPVIT